MMFCWPQWFPPERFITLSEDNKALLTDCASPLCTPNFRTVMERPTTKFGHLQKKRRQEKSQFEAQSWKQGCSMNNSMAVINAGARMSSHERCLWGATAPSRTGVYLDGDVTPMGRRISRPRRIRSG